jgi:hypothetical protein
LLFLFLSLILVFFRRIFPPNTTLFFSVSAFSPPTSFLKIF